jgi:lipopolysaccharide/colanic/teichoic acid biosynthesis glycosyltransferase
VSRSRVSAEQTQTVEPTQLEVGRSIGSDANGSGPVVAATGTAPTAEVAVDPGEVAVEHAQIARVAKWLMDVVGALLLLILLCPALLMIAILIKLDSRGPVFFRHTRIGRDGRPFRMLKFRTMVNGADAQKPAIVHLNEAKEGFFKISEDPRLTRVGRFLRSISLDELPQLLHVITGHMSLVGPRPLVPEEDRLITAPYRRRLTMRPGITGVWQTAGGARLIPLGEMVEMDVAYVDGWSIRWDLQLLWRTARMVLARAGI